MTAIGIETGPRLAGAVPPPGRYSLAQRWRQRRERLLPLAPDRAYDDPIVTTRMLLRPIVLVNDPASVRRVLVENVANYPKTPMERRFFTAIFGAGLLGIDGDLWRAHRRVMAPAFDPRSVASYAPAVSEAAAAFIEHWTTLGDGARVDMAEEMTDLTLRIIARTMFSSDNPELLTAIRGSLGGGSLAIGELSIQDLLPVLQDRRMRERERTIARIFAPLDDVVHAMMAERTAGAGRQPADLLGRLMAASDDEGGGKLTAREVRDEVVTIFVAGHETTAMTMSWTWYLLSQHPAWVDRLQEELARVLGGRGAGQADLPKLALTRRIIDESMRLYPAAPGLSMRVALDDDTLCGRKIAKGAAVAVLPWVLHRHRALWDAPERFDPDRFLPERSAGRHRFAFMPFGGGPRVCIGQLLAVNESVT